MDNIQILPIQKAANLLGGFLGMAEKCDVSVQAAYKWAKQVPVERCKQIEELTKGKVTRSELRPDIF